MDSGTRPWSLLIVFSILCLQSMADDASGSLLFLDSPTHPYLHSSVPNSMSVIEVGAAVSILLGLAPSPMLSPATSSKLNELLLPNPFDRPRNVLMLEIALAQDSEQVDHPDNFLFSSAIKSKVLRNVGSVEVELPDTGVAFFSLDGPDSDSYAATTDKELSDFASSLGGSYVSDNSESLNGELIIPLSSGFKMSLHMSKKADRKFTTAMLYLINNIRKATERMGDLSQVTPKYAELVGGYFEGIKALQEEYGSKDIAQKGIELLLTTVSKAVDTLREIHEGETVAVFLFSKTYPSLPQRMLNVTYVLRPSPRVLEEVKISSNITAAAEVALVRLTLAWITGLVLLIATFIGVYLLVNMPLTRDTLLYSNVKLD